jgi:hypothetical protein
MQSPLPYLELLLRRLILLFIIILQLPGLRALLAHAARALSSRRQRPSSQMDVQAPTAAPSDSRILKCYLQAFGGEPRICEICLNRSPKHDAEEIHQREEDKPSMSLSILLCLFSTTLNRMAALVRRLTPVTMDRSMVGPPRRRQRGFGALILLFLQALAYCSGRPSRVTGETVLYRFLRAQCLARQVQEAAAVPVLGPLAINSTALCLDGNGIGNARRSPLYGARVASRQGFASLRSMVTPGVLTLELWLRPSSTASTQSSGVIMSVAHPRSLDRDIFVWQSGADIQFQISLGGVGWTFPLTLSSFSRPVHLACSIHPLPIPDDPVPYYLGLYYVNGQQADYSTAGVTTSVSFNASRRLYFLSEPASRSSTSAWQGEIYLFSIYNRNLSEAEVRQNYEAGLPNSVPAAANATVVVGQNGEVGTHYDTPAFYLSHVPVLELANISLPAVDVDERPTSPNYNKSDARLATFIASLPARGTLYQLNGSVITSVPALVDPAGNHTVRFRPQWNDLSWPKVYTRFRYYAVDGVTGAVSETASIAVVVRSAHKPPVPKVGNLTVRAGKYVIIPVSGTPTPAFPLAGANIIGTPKLGNLYLVYRNGTIATRSKVTVKNGRSVQAWGFRVAYRYRGPQNLSMLPSGIIAYDNFTFTVRDTRNVTSVVGMIRINISSPIAAIPSQALGLKWAYTCNEASFSPLQIFGKDEDDLQSRPLCFEFLTLPSRGVLQRTDTQALVQRGEIIQGTLSTPYGMSLKLRYKGEPGYFSTPSRKWKGPPLNMTADSFRYRVMVCNRSSVASVEVEQAVVVVNVNEPTGFTLPATRYSALAYSKQYSSDGQGIITLKGVSVVDPDLGVDPVVVSITAKYGRIKLNSTYLGMADFRSWDYCNIWRAGWRCRGRGDDTRMIFVAAPKAVGLLLEGAQYRSSKTFVNDTVVISIYDGQGGSCLPRTAFPSYSNRSSGCLVSTQSFVVRVGESARTAVLPSPQPTGSIYFYVLGMAGLAVLLSAYGIWRLRISILELQALLKTEAASRAHERVTPAQDDMPTSGSR